LKLSALRFSVNEQQFENIGKLFQTDDIKVIKVTPQWPLIVAFFYFSKVVLTGDIKCVFTVKKATFKFLGRSVPRQGSRLRPFVVSKILKMICRLDFNNLSRLQKWLTVGRHFSEILKVSLCYIYRTCKCLCFKSELHSIML